MWLSQKRLFWTLYFLKRNFLKALKRKQHVISHIANKEKNDFLSFKRIATSTLLKVISVFLIAIGFQILNHLLHPYYNWLELKLKFSPRVSGEGYIDLLTSVIGGCIVLIGLYYAAIMTIASAIYTRVPRQVRNLLRHERIGKAYLHYVAYLLIFTISFLAFHIIGYAPNYLALACIILLSCIIVLGFVKIGHRAFDLFEPASLTQEIFTQLKETTKIVTAKGYGWKSSEIQNDAHSKACSAINDLYVLSEVTLKNKHMDRTILWNLANQIIAFLVFYRQVKKLIPTNSEWYPTYQEHRDWSTASQYPYRKLALTTNTMLLPNSIAQQNYIEESLITILTNHILKYEENYQIIDFYNNYFFELSREGNNNNACKIISTLGDRIIASIIEKKLGDIQLTSIEALGKALIDIMLFYGENIRSSDPIYALRIKQVSLINWANPRSQYLQEIPLLALPRLEKIQKEIGRELFIENYRITPDSYIAEQLIQVDASSFKESFEAFFNLTFTIYQSWIGQLKDYSPLLCASLASRQLEYMNKAENQLGLYQQKWDENFKKIAENQDSLRIDFDLFRKTLETKTNDLLEDISYLALKLAQHQTVLSKYPDYFGQFIAVMGERIMKYICNGEFDNAKKIFGNYFGASLLQLKKLTSSQPTTAQGIFSAYSPLLTLMDISGYAYLFTDFYDDTSLLNEVIVKWDHYLEDKKNLTVIEKLMQLHSTQFNAPGFDFYWRSQAREKLASSPKLTTPLLKAVTDDLLGISASFYGGDIFSATYLKVQPESTDLNFGQNCQHLIRDIARHEE